ncbi:MAG: putative 2-dehydropantoate 2-reductase [Bacteroidales bacterium]|jgi:2-dehydropantoate 2-reductase|nr:putative 2-dehydropantoate 2-reductase [Bacteroidales bacterium]
MGLRYAVIGTGALGGYFGGKLANAGHDVHFLFHSDYSHVAAHGLKVESVNGNFHLHPINAYQHTADMPTCDVVLVCLKTTSNHLLKDLLPPLLKPTTLVILVQNGLGMEERLAQAFPNISIAGGLGFICASKRGPGLIEHMDYGKLTLGLYKHEERDDNDREAVDQSLLRTVVADFNEAGVESHYSSDLALARWKKLVWNVPYNGLCVVLNSSTDQLMNQPHSLAILRELMLEVIAGARACGHDIDDSFAQAMLDSTRTMTPYAPSMKLDFDFKRPLEIEAIYSNPIQAAAAAGQSLPRIQQLEQQLHYIQSTYLG